MPSDNALSAETLNISDAARAIGIGRSTLYRLIRNGEIPAERFPGISEARIRTSAIRNYLQRGTPVPSDDGRPKRARKAVA